MEKDQIEKIREVCMCMGKIHRIINNCLSCGKIVCKSEGQGPCLFCGNLVYSKQNQFKEDPNYHKSLDNDYEALKAMTFKEKLLDYDKSEIATKNVFDEEADWYEIKQDIWQNKEIRDMAQKKVLETEKEEEENKKYIAYDINFKTGDIKEINKTINYKEKKDEAKKFIKEEEAKLKEKRKKGIKQKEVYNQEEKELLFNISEELKNVYKLTDLKEKKEQYKKISKFIQHDDIYENFNQFHKLNKKKISEKEKNFDKELYNLENYYDYKCLSMWQPWASLAIEGIKRFEGRTWTTNYRGPLWIHAGGHPFTQTDINDTRDLYKKIYKRFPGYPQKLDKGYVIGIVDLQDVWTNEEFKQRIGKPYSEESDRPYVFVFRNPRRLLVPVKIVGEQKIFDLKKQVVERAISSLKKVPTNWAPFFAAKFEHLNRNNITRKKSERKENNNIQVKKVEPKKEFEFRIIRETTNIVCFENDNKILIDFLIEKDDHLGKSLHKGYDHKKYFRLNNMKISESLLKLFKKHSRNNISQTEFSFDIFRLGIKDKKITLDKKYKFLYFAGNVVKIVDELVNYYLMKDNNLMLVLNNKNVQIVHIDKKKKSRMLSIKGNYCTVGIGFY